MNDGSFTEGRRTRPNAERARLQPSEHRITFVTAVVVSTLILAAIFGTIKEVGF